MKKVEIKYIQQFSKCNKSILQDCHYLSMSSSVTYVCVAYVTPACIAYVCIAYIALACVAYVALACITYIAQPALLTLP